MGKRFVTLAALTVCLAVPAVAPAGVTPVTTVNDDFFNPIRPVTGNGGFTFYEWDWNVNNQDTHNVRQDDKLFRSGDLTAFQQPFTVAVSAGSFPYYCEHHGGPNGQGMHGVIKVRPGIFKSVNPDEFGVAWAADLTQTGKAFDVRYRVNGGDWKIWKNDTTRTSGTFGRNNDPVDVKSGKTYDIEARSEKSVSKASKRSDWSPKATNTIP